MLSVTVNHFNIYLYYIHIEYVLLFESIFFLYYYHFLYHVDVVVLKLKLVGWLLIFNACAHLSSLFLPLFSLALSFLIHYFFLLKTLIVQDSTAPHYVCNWIDLVNDISWQHVSIGLLHLYLRNILQYTYTFFSCVDLHMIKRHK